jgi:hypothetical protein
MFVLQIKLFQKFVKRRVVREFRLLGLQLQYEEFKSPEAPRTIERARISLFKLTTELLHDPALVPLFLGDLLFLPFFMSLLFEKNLRPLVLAELEKYMSLKVAGEAFCDCVMKIIEYATFSGLNEEVLLLQRDLFRTMNKLRLYQILVPLCGSFRNQFPLFNSSIVARELLFEIVKFFIGVSPIAKIADLAELETALSKFQVLEVEEYQFLLSLAAGEDLQDFSADFQIKNGEIMNVLFKLYRNDPQLKIVSLAHGRCDQHLNRFARFDLAG